MEFHQGQKYHIFNSTVTPCIGARQMHALNSVTNMVKVTF